VKKKKPAIGGDSSALLEKVVEEVPAMRFFRAVLAIVSVAGSIALWDAGVHATVVVPLFIAGMILIVLFQQVAKMPSRDLKAPAQILIWTITLLFVASLTMAVSAVSLGIPSLFRRFLLDEQVQPEKAAYEAILKLSGTALVETRSPVPFLKVFSFQSHVDHLEEAPGEGYVWDTDFDASIPRQPRGEAGTCERAQVVSADVLKITARLGTITRATSSRPGYVDCEVQAQRLKIVSRAVPIAEQTARLVGGSAVKFVLPRNTASFQIVVTPKNGGAEILTPASPIGDKVSMTVTNGVAVVTPRG